MSQVRAGAAYVELLLKDGSFTKGLNAAGGKLRSFGKSVSMIGGGLAAAGAAVVAPLAAMAGQFADLASQVDDISQRTGLSAEAISTLGYAAQLSGADMETLEKGVMGMQKSLVALKEGAAGATEDFAALGITAADLEGLSLEDQFKRIADGVAGIDDPTQRAVIAMRVLGKSGIALVPMLSQGAAGIAALQSEADQLNLKISAEDAASGAAYGDAMDRVGKVLMGLSSTIGAAVAPMLTDLVNLVSNVGGAAIAWAKDNRELIATVFKVGAAVAAAGVALVAMGGVIVGVGAVLSGLAAILSAAGTALAVMGSIVAAILSPVGLLVAGAAALGGYLVYSSGAGSKAMEYLAGVFNFLKDEALASFGAISNALAAGDIAAAGAVLWTYLKLQWTRGVAFLSETWGGFSDYVMGTANGISYAIAGAFFDAGAAVLKGWNSTVDFLADTWSRFATGVKQVWNSTTGFLQKAWVRLKGLIKSDIAVQAELAAIDQNTADANAGDAAARDKAIADRRAARERAAAAINAGRDELKANLGSARNAEAEARRKARADAIAAGEADVANARAELDAANARASAATKPEIGKPTGPDPLKIDPPEIPDVNLSPDAAAALEGVGSGVDKELASSVAGGFNTLGLGGYVSGFRSAGVGQLGAAVALASAPGAIAKSAPLDAVNRSNAPAAASMPAEVARAIQSTATSAADLVRMAQRGRLVFG
jgi:hypothetical protein